MIMITWSIQRMQTPQRLGPLTLWCDLYFSSRTRKMMLLDVAYWIVPWYQVWCLWVYYFTRYHHLFILCDLWPSPVTFSFCQGYLHFKHCIYFMLLNVCTKNEVSRFNRIESQSAISLSLSSYLYSSFCLLASKPLPSLYFSRDHLFLNTVHLIKNWSV